MVCCFFCASRTSLVTLLYRGDLVPSKVGTGLVTPLGFKPRTFRTGI